MSVILDLSIDIQLLYILCALSVVLILISHVVTIRQISVPSGMVSFLLMICIAYAYNHIHLAGLFWVVIMLVVGVLYQRSYHRVIMICVMLILAFLLSIHALPGFKNPLVLDQVLISKLSTPYSMYLNLDKFSAGIVIFWSIFSTQERSKLDLRIVPRVIPVAAITIIVSLVIASFGIIAFDYKLSPYLFIFAINNLFFTCMAEESYFRGLIHKQISSRLQYGYAIVISSALFGLAHYGAGRVDYVVAAIVAGLGYAYVYQKTNSIGASIFTHWIFNLLHFIFFTYPFIN